MAAGPAMQRQNLPFVGFGQILFHPAAGLVTLPQEKLRVGLALVGCFAKPGNSSIIMFRVRVAQVKMPEHELWKWVSGFGGLAKPAFGFGVIGLDPFTLFIRNSEHHLPPNISVFSRFSIPTGRRSQVLINTQAIIVVPADHQFAVAVTVFGGLAIPLILLKKSQATC